MSFNSNSSFGFAGGGGGGVTPGNFVPYSGANQTVDLNTQTLLAGQTAFASSQIGSSSFWSIRSLSSVYAGIFTNQTSFTGTNYTIAANGIDVLIFNVPTQSVSGGVTTSGIFFQVSGGLLGTPLGLRGYQDGAVYPNVKTYPLINTNIPISNSFTVPTFYFQIANNTYVTGAQNRNIGFQIASNTWSANGSSVMGDAYTFYVDGPPTISAPLTATRTWAAGFGGNVDIAGGLKIGNSSTSGYVWTATDTIGNGSWQAAGGGTPALTATQIAVGDGSNLMTSYSSLVFVGPTGNGPQLQVIGANPSILLDGTGTSNLTIEISGSDQYWTGGGASIFRTSGGTQQFQINTNGAGGGVTIASGKMFQLGNNFTPGPPTNITVGYVVVTDAAGNSCQVVCWK